MSKKDYLIEQVNYNKRESSFYETIFALSNGVVGIRPTIEFNSVYSRPGLYVNGVYDYALSVKDQIVNLPNCTKISVIIDGQLVNLDYTDIIYYHRILDMKRSVLKTDYSFIVNFKKIHIRRTEFLNSNNVYSCRMTFESSDNCKIRVEYELDYSIGNLYHGGYINQDVRSFHNILEEYKFHGNRLYSKFITPKTNKKISFLSTINLSSDADIHKIIKKQSIGVSADFVCKKNTPVTFDLCVGINTSCDKSFDEYYDNHIEYWNNKWSSFGFVEFNDKSLNKRMVYSAYQLLSCYSNNLKLGANIPPRGLSSGYHHGHFFFNTELYMVPIYSWISPEWAKSLLFYRINTLNNAISVSEEMGHKGAFWSEESGVDGFPAGPTVIKNYIKDEEYEEWTGRKVKHIGADVLYACQKYVNITGDTDFEQHYVVRLAIEIVKYYLSIFEYNESNNCYEILDVIGPDEYHIGVNNNAYTNYMAGFTLTYFFDLYSKYNFDLVDICIDEVKQISKFIKNINVKNNVIEQFDDYFCLDDFQIKHRMNNGLPLIPDDLQKEIFGFGNINYNIVKQSDVVMLLSFFPHSFPFDIVKDSFKYYEKRTIHESSLSATHAGLVAGFIKDYETALKYMKLSSGFNLDFEPRENYNNGIHYAAHAGAWLILLEGILGLSERNNSLCINTDILNNNVIEYLHINIKFRRNSYNIQYDKTGFTIKCLDNSSFVILDKDGNEFNSDENGVVVLDKT